MPSLDSLAQPRRLPWVWGVAIPPDQLPTPAETGGRLATRALITTADPATVFGWLCQLRRAPYSYDWLDNFGRRSPRHADASLLELARGQRIMTIFTLTDFEPGRWITIKMNRGWPTKLFGAVTVSYHVDPLPGSRCRLTALVWLPPIGRLLARARRYLLAWGDVVMMRKQLRVLAKLAERDSQTPSGPRDEAVTVTKVSSQSQSPTPAPPPANSND